jgi:replication initiation protein RepC
MDPHLPTTPFGRRSLSLAMVAAQAVAKACPKDATAHKWRVFRNLTEAKDRLDLSDRALAVLSALLTFHPDTALTPDEDIVVFPSNRELSVRAHGPAPATLRRALAQLVDAGLVIRRDSPNGKRYARRGEGGSIKQAFGFDLTPLVARAAEFERLAGEVRAEARARHLLREEISLQRRDVAKTIATAIEENLPGPWSDLADRFRQLGGMPPRSASAELLQALAHGLRGLRCNVDKCLAESTKTKDSSANESQVETHHQNSKPEAKNESEPGFQESQGRSEADEPEAKRSPQRPFPLSMVLQACPDFVMFARHGISSWRDFISVAETVRGASGISPSAWAEAVEAMGAEEACVALAAIVQRSAMIKSPGGYLRNLTEKARAGKFSAWPMLMALWRLQHGQRRQT